MSNLFLGDSLPGAKSERELLDAAEELAKTAYVIADAMEAEANRFRR
ncbi:MAG: hypothetical protein AB7O52_09955 [Planctomycetota bacterium]